MLHITGRRDFDDLRQRLARSATPPHYRLFEYLETLADALAAGDLVVARAGGSVFELAAAGRPAILVPYPHAPPTTRPATRAGWTTRARPWWCPTPS